MISKEAFLGLIICISCKLVYGQILSVNDSNVAIAEALRSNIQNHRQSFDKPIEETLPKDPPKPVDDKKIHYIEPGVVTNSHKPQYFDSANYDTEATGEGNTSEKIDKINEKFDSNANNDQFNVDINDEYKDDYRPNHHLRNKHNQIKMVLVKLLEKKEQKRKFASVLPILRMLTPPQRLVMASLVSKQITADAKNPGLNIEQVKAMFGNDPNVTSDLMLPILLDIANMIRDAKDHMRAQEPRAPQAQLLRRSFNVDEDEGSMMESSYEYPEEDDTMANKKPQAKSLEETPKSMKIAAKIPSVIKNSNVKVHGDLKVGVEIEDETADSADIVKGNLTVSNSGQSATMVVPINGVNTTMDLANSTIIVNGTELGEDLPVAEKLRALNRFIDRNGNIFVLARPPWSPGGPKIMVHPGPGPLLHRKSNNELLMASQRRRVPGPVRKNPGENKQKCDMFTNTLCLDTIDYPEDAIMGSIRRNQAAMGALLADFPEISADSAIDGISAKQENKYTAEHYMNSISRREDGMGPGGATGFMCPSTVKYARPQKARATSGQWKYIVNTGEHTQTLRLEKCLRPKEPCTYLTENFKSKCVQVYNYHRLLTWDQQNGLHMDIFKVPTCCSCHIEGYSVAFPPHASRPVESTSEHFPGEDLSHDVNPYEDGQPSIRHTSKFPIQAETFPILGDSHNIIPGSTFNKFGDDNPSFHDIKHLQSSNVFESVNNNYHPDLFQHGNANIRNVKKPPRVISGNIGLPSFLEPPSKPPAPVITNFIKGQESNVYQTKHKPFLATHYKRGAPGTQGHSNAKRPGRRPLRKKNSNVNDDQLVGATNVHENPTIINMETFEDINSSADEYERSSPRTSPIPTRTTTARTVGASTKFSLKNVSPTTERYRPKTTPADHGTAVLKDISLNRRVNYNYHPIIDFFEEPSKKDMANDRMDNGSTYIASSEESDWRPMAPPVAFASGETRPQ